MDMAAAARDIAEATGTVPCRPAAALSNMIANAFNDMTRSLRDHPSAQRLLSAFFHRPESARDAIISTDARGSITFWNRSAEATFGYTEEEVIGQPITMLIAESDRAAYAAGLPDPNADDLTFGHILEVTGLRKDGTHFPSEFSLAVRHGREGTALTAVVRDVIGASSRRIRAANARSSCGRRRRWRPSAAPGALRTFTSSDGHSRLRRMLIHTLPPETSGHGRRGNRESGRSRGGTHAPFARIQPRQV